MDIGRCDRTDVYESLWRFAKERQDVFFRRIEDCTQVRTNDEILRRYKFTNAYRAADRVSQYLIRKVIYKGDHSVQEIFFRILIFKVFNRISTWEFLESVLGEVRWSEFSFPHYAQLLSALRRDGTKLYSAAYIMPSGRESFGSPEKHRNHLLLIEQMMRDGVPEQVSRAASMKNAYGILLGYPTIGPFLAYQYIIDINYSELTDFSEMEFVVAGPGALSGIRKCFTNKGHYSDEDLIRYVAVHQQEEFAKRGLEFQTLWGRPLQLIDCQNLFCEVDKYARIAHPEFNSVGKRNRIKQKFRPNPKPIDYWFPPKWGINERMRTKTNEAESLVTAS